MMQILSRPVKRSMIEVGHLKLHVKGNLICVCAWCNRARDINGQWHRFDAELLVDAAVRTTHTICSDCKTDCLEQDRPSVSQIPSLGLAPA